MNKSKFTISKKERELMELFWDAGVPLSRTKILERASMQKCSWKPNSVHILINALLDKGALQVAGYYLNSRKLGRTFEARVTREDYAVMQVKIALDSAETSAGLSPAKLLKKLLVEQEERKVG